MNSEVSGADAISELRKISSELEEIWEEISSLKNVFRSLVRGRDFEGQMRRAQELESRVLALRGVFFNQTTPSSSRRLHPLKVYWCYTFLAAAALAEMTARDYNELLAGVRSTHTYRQESIERFRVAIQGAEKEWGQLSRYGANAQIE